MWFNDFRGMPAVRYTETDRNVHHNTPLCYREWSKTFLNVLSIKDSCNPVNVIAFLLDKDRKIFENQLQISTFINHNLKH